MVCTIAKVYWPRSTDCLRAKRTNALRELKLRGLEATSLNERFLKRESFSEKSALCIQATIWGKQTIPRGSGITKLPNFPIAQN